MSSSMPLPRTLPRHPRPRPLGHGATLLLAAAIALAAAGPARAGQGLAAPAADTLWPQWQARLAVQTTATAPLALWTALDAPAARGVQAGALLGDYHFAQPGFGSLRATSGLMIGPRGSLPGLGTLAAPGERIGLALQPLPPALAAAGETEAMPYLGIGYSGLSARHGLRLSADLGLVAETVTRARLGAQAADGTARAWRLAPVLQVELSVAF